MIEMVPKKSINEISSKTKSIENIFNIALLTIHLVPGGQGNKI